MRNIKIYFIISILSIGISGHSMSRYQSEDDLRLFCRLSNFYFKKYVHNGLVNYQNANKNPSELKALYQLIRQVDLSEATEKELKAFYINAYNILVIYQISEIYPIKTPLDEKGFFSAKKHLIGGQELTLDELEKDKMIKEFKDSRFHFVLSCAAVSCPKLANFAYQPEDVEKLLEERTMIALNDTNFVKVDRASKKVILSKVFDWYRGDFGQTNSAILSYVNKYRENKIPSDFTVSFYEYNWTLNERK